MWDLNLYGVEIFPVHELSQSIQAIYTLCFPDRRDCRYSLDSFFILMVAGQGSHCCDPETDIPILHNRHLLLSYLWDKRTDLIRWSNDIYFRFVKNAFIHHRNLGRRELMMLWTALNTNPSAGTFSSDIFLRYREAKDGRFQFIALISSRKFRRFVLQKIGKSVARDKYFERSIPGNNFKYMA